MESTRIADYFVVIGASEDSLEPLPAHEQPFETSDPLKLAYSSKILDRYPLEDRDDLSMPTGLTLFCLPDGLHLHSTPKSPSFFSFVQTSESGAQLIGCCLTFFEELTESQRESFNEQLDASEAAEVSATAMSHLKLYIPKCLCLLSQWPFVSSFKKYLCHLYRLSLTPCKIPIERYICNFLDDVPAPPPGLVEVSYFIGTENVTFKRPPSNEPNAWSTMPMTPLFECLSLDHIVDLFSLVLSERQIVFISSQNSLLTSCAESILSLIYPCRWTHVYIPILPRRLLGVLAAPLPFVVGVHTSFLPPPAPPRAQAPSASSSVSSHMSEYRPTCFDGHAVFSSETVRVYLDENRVEVGSLGPPPRLPDGRYKKLMKDLTTMAPAFEMRLPDWKRNQLPFYDSAFEMSVRPDLADGTLENKDKVDEKGVRGSFLKFMVTILKNYRQYLVYPSPSEPFPLVKFREEDYINDHPSDWQPILHVLLQSQAFYQFVDLRVSYSGWSDHEIVFFDESIEAKINRLMFRLHRRDTPFLLDNSFKHAKTFVAPSVDMDGLDGVVEEEEEEKDVQEAGDAAEDGSRTVSDAHKHTQVYAINSHGERVYYYQNFPRLNPRLYRKGSVKAASSNMPSRKNRSLSKVASQGRLKRANVLRLTTVPFAEANVSSSSSDPVASIFSTFLVLFSRVVSTGLSPPVFKRAPPTLAQVLNSLNIAHPVNMTQTTDGKTTAEEDGTWTSPVLGDIEMTRPSVDMREARGDEDEEGGTDVDQSDIGADSHGDETTLSTSAPLEDTASSSPVFPSIKPVPLQRAASADSSLSRDTAGSGTPKGASTPITRAESHGPTTTRESFSSPAIAPFSQFGDVKEQQQVSGSGRDGEESLGFRDIISDCREEYLTIARAAIETAFELFNVMRKRGYPPDEEVFRSLSDACAVCGAGDRIVDVLEEMTVQGMLPDVQICSAASRALSFSTNTGTTASLESGESVMAVTPKDITEAAESRDFRKLRRNNRASSASSVVMNISPSSGNRSNESSFARSMKRLSISADNIFSLSPKPSPASHATRDASSRSGEEFCSVTTLVGDSTTGATVGTNFESVASPRCTTQVTLADRTLDMLYTDLTIDLANVDGTSCPNFKCRKPLKIFEIIDKFSPDANTYTVKCPYCAREFVPRFTVHSTNTDWIGSSGLGSVLWCELLSPWVLQKEILNVIDNYGIETIVSPQFRKMNSTDTQSSVIFWNMMVYFRLYGMPYVFLIAEKLSMAFLIPLDD